MFFRLRLKIEHALVRLKRQMGARLFHQHHQQEIHQGEVKEEGK